jgi:hypothetical protein
MRRLIDATMKKGSPAPITDERDYNNVGQQSRRHWR